MIQDKPLLIDSQFVDTIGKYKLYYNPTGYGGVTIVDVKSQDLLNFCNGHRTIEQLSILDGRPLDVIIKEIKDLADQEVIQISSQFTKELHQIHKRKGTLACWLHITNNCNLACGYCYIHKCPGNMSLETGKLAITKMVESCLKHNMNGIEIKFAGGEPLLRFNLIKELVSYSQQFKNQVKIKYSLVTNGIPVTQQVAEYLKYYNVAIGVSLDGIGSVNDAIRFDKNGHGSFYKVIKGLKLLKNAGNKIGILTTVSKVNYNGLLELTKFLLDNDYGFRFSMEKNCESGQPELLNYITELNVSLNQCYDYIEANLPSRNFFELHKFGDVGFMRPVNRCCSAGDSFFALGHDGKIGVCGMGLTKPFLTLEKSKDILEDVRENCSTLRESIASNYPTCDKCVWKTSCAGGCPLQTKSTYGIYTVPSIYCEVNKTVLPRLLRIKGMQMIRDYELNI